MTTLEEASWKFCQYNIVSRFEHCWIIGGLYHSKQVNNHKQKYKTII